MKILITGGSGFIGSNIAETLLTQKQFPITKIVIIDNLSLGKKKFIDHLMGKHLDFYEEDLLNFDKILNIFKKYHFDLVFHMSANSDISYGTLHTDWDLKQGPISTYNILECMRRTNIKKIIFASTSAIYGEATTLPTPEDYGPLFPISLYGASKLACEGLISSFCHNFDFQAWIYRFANIVGKNGTHGAVFDFIKKLRNNQNTLKILGDGKQAKPYLYVQDCVDGMLHGFKKAKENLNYFNLTCNGSTTVDIIAHLVIKKLGLKNVKITHTGGIRGWTGDVPKVRLSSQKINKLNWSPKYSSKEAVEKAIDVLLKQI